jgi:hypothetical protein
MTRLLPCRPSDRDPPLRGASAPRARRSMRAALVIRHVAVLMLIIAGMAGCAKALTRSLVQPSDFATLDGRSAVLKAHMANGSIYVLTDWRADTLGSAIVGAGSLYDANRTVIESGSFRLATDSVRLFETNVVRNSGASTALTVVFGITAVVAGICATDPKACFGSCPTIYAPGADGELTLQAEAFSSSIAPALEATDIDMLLHTRPTSRDYALRVTNEALETHVIRGLNLLAVPRRADGRVYRSGTGFRQASGATAPVLCTAAEGDCMDAVADADGIERASLADSTDLAAREFIDLRFDSVPDGDIGLVIVTRQTLLTTFLIYQALAWMGGEAGRWLASLETAASTGRERARDLGDLLGGIDVLVQDAGGQWIEAGRVGETGPIAADTWLVTLPGRARDVDRTPEPDAGALPSAGGPLRVRLRLTQGLWRLDRVALTSLGQTVEPLRIAPSGVSREGVEDAAALESLLDPALTLVTLPGDALDIQYRLPPNPSGYDFFVEATGYYLEWMRQEWLAEENPLLAALLLVDPATALRRLAPQFKAREAGMERLFWNSRYVETGR